MEILLGWLIFSVLAGVIASSKGRSGIGFFMLAVFLTPLVGLIAAVAMSPIHAASEGDRRERVACFKCAELILPAASVCKHCGADLAGHRALLERKSQVERDERLASERAAAAERAKKAQAIGRSVSGLFTWKK